MKQDLESTNTITLDPIIQNFVDKLEAERGPHLWEITVEQARAHHAKMQAIPVHLESAEAADLTIETADH